MGRTFAYCRVSTIEQNIANQVQAIESAGYPVKNNRVISETVSGSVQAMKRPAFKALVEHKLESGDCLVVLKLDRLGRDNIDVQETITTLQSKGIQVISLDLPASDLTSANGKLILQMFAAFAEFERNRIRERTHEGLQRAKREGKRLGRPAATDTTKAIQQCKAKGFTQSQAVKATGFSLPTIKRHWNKAVSA